VCILQILYIYIYIYLYIYIYIYLYTQIIYIYIYIYLYTQIRQIYVCILQIFQGGNGVITFADVTQALRKLLHNTYIYT